MRRGIRPGVISRRRNFVARAAATRAANRMRTRTRTGTRRNPTSGVGVTEQYDAKTVYRKRRMPRFRKRRWRQFKNKVAAVSEKDLGTQTVVFNTSITASNTTSGNQTLFDCALYPSTSGALTYWNDLDQIGQYNALADTTATAGLKISPSSKIIFKSAILDITVRNGSTVRNTGAYSYSSTAKMEVDVYEITVRRGDEEGVTYSNLLALFNQNPTRTSAIGDGVAGAPSKIDLNLRGVTPFDCAYSLSNFGIKIWKKTKYQLSNGEQFTYQYRDPRRYVLNQRHITSNEGPFEPRMTRCLLIIGRMCPGVTVGSVDGTFQENLIVGCTRKYFYKVENWSEDRTGYANL